MNYRLSANRSNIIKLALCIIFYLSMLSARASCHVDKTLRVRFMLPDITLSNSSGPGSILSQKTMDIDDGETTQDFQCSGDGQLTALPRYQQKNGRDIYATGLKGIGYRLFLDTHPFPWHSNLHCQDNNCHLPWPVAPRITFQLVQTLPVIQPGHTIKQGVYGVIRTDSGKPSVLIVLQHAVQVHQESCQVENKTVDFGNVYLPPNTQPGTELSSQAFTLAYTCPYQHDILARWEGPSDKTGYLLSPELKNKNLAVSLLEHDGSKLYLNRFFHPESGSGIFSFQARLLSTGTVRSGTFNATASLHLIYP